MPTGITSNVKNCYDIVDLFYMIILGNMLHPIWTHLYLMIITPTLPHLYLYHNTIYLNDDPHHHNTTSLSDDPHLYAWPAV